MKITIPIEPKAQRRFRIGKRGQFSRAYKDKKQVQEESDIMTFLAKHRPDEPMIGPIVMQISCYLKIPKSTSNKRRDMMMSGCISHTKKPDLDNMIKNLFDCMTKLQIWRDDSQVYSLFATKHYDDGNGPRWEIEIKEL